MQETIADFTLYTLVSFSAAAIAVILACCAVRLHIEAGKDNGQYENCPLIEAALWFHSGYNIGPILFFAGLLWIIIRIFAIPELEGKIVYFCQNAFAIATWLSGMISWFCGWDAECAINECSKLTSSQKPN